MCSTPPAITSATTLVTSEITVSFPRTDSRPSIPRRGPMALSHDRRQAEHLGAHLEARAFHTGHVDFEPEPLIVGKDPDDAAGRREVAALADGQHRLVAQRGQLRRGDMH